MSFRKAVDNLLLPLGFEREKSTWTRSSAGFLDTVHLHNHGYGTLVDYQCIDLTSKAIIAAAVPEWSHSDTYFIRMRTAPLKQSFRIKEDKPSDLADGIRTHILPFFDQMRTPEGQCAIYAQPGAIGASGHTLYKGIAHWRAGDIDAADKILRSSQRSPKSSLPGMKALRAHLGLSEQQID